ncbi:hypothetical protein K503DRAFT_795733 [Rhizopogon vinicolor AM-OR11-026]|uniref:Inhibitor I9 domain-containing protein n=1 Tax=Rhizopogon vinicolor AM-OR11-026 TaxID=1314800 RepID=A0A1B7NGW3_9AGAM|nr:hypothetical protein K503DRAFT_795733 [Rhizopogon vinicolor AM-OR11-026]
MQKFIVTLNDGVSYDTVKRQVEEQGGSIVDDSMRNLGMMTIQIPDSGAKQLQSFAAEFILEPDQQVSTQAAL